MYSSAVSLTVALHGVRGQRHTLAIVPLGKTRYLLYRRPGGPQGWSGWAQKISPTPRFDTRTVHPIASRYPNPTLAILSQRKDTGRRWVDFIADLDVNPLPPNVIYICRTTPLTSRCCILNIYSTNVRTEYFKHAA
jgi:hypothetical protein